MTSELQHLDFSFASSCLLPVMPSFACFPGHHASVKTPDLNHKRCHLHCSHLDHGNVLFTPTRYLPEIIYLQVQVRWTSRPGAWKTLTDGNLSLLWISELLAPAVPSWSLCFLPILLLPGLCLSSAFFFAFFFSHPFFYTLYSSSLLFSVPLFARSRQ